MGNRHLVAAAEDVLLRLAKLGARWSQVGGPVAYLSIEQMPRLGQSKMLRFARLVRAAVVLERKGALVANIDRMGEVVGWHLSVAAQSGPGVLER
ncbi:MAG: hypothetical protein WC378_00235 [Opitutaceae bacterium]|jgi:hypothetical protein